MGKSKQYRLHHIRFSPGQIKIFFLSLLVIVVVQILFLTNILNSKKRNEIALATVYGKNFSTAVMLSMSQSVNTSQILEKLYFEYGDGFVRDFDKICSRLVEDNVVVGSLYLAPNGIIENAYPLSVKQATIGFEPEKDPVQGEKARLARETEKVTVSGPHELLEGGTGFIIRNPFFEDGIFKGFTIVVLDTESFFNQIIDRLEDKESDFNLSVWKDDNSNIVTNEYNCIVNFGNKNASRDVTLDIRLPNELWHVSVEPKSGWGYHRFFAFEIVITVLFGLIILLLIFFRLYDSAKKLYDYEHDALTGLLTRSAFYRRVRMLFKQNPDTDYDIVVADIENFKLLNSLYGTERCDELLCYIGKGFCNFPQVIYMSRYAGDKFITIYESKRKPTARGILDFTKRLIEEAPIPNFKIKYGYYSCVDKNLPVNLISDRALLAVRSILHNYDLLIANYEGDISKKMLRKQVLESSFETAIKDKRFKVWYQPKFDAVTEKLVGAEALVRWISDDDTLISPIDFINIFEEDGLIVHLDEYVFRTVCSVIREWIDSGITVVPISVNVSRKTLNHRGIAKKYKKIVDEYDIPIEYISLEITESAAYTSSEIKELVEDLKSTGFRLDMDDFGTGSSSLASLNILPFDVIKLDKSLIDFIGRDDGNELLKHTIELAHFKNMTVIAEGVETKEQLDFLRSLNCDIIQGFYYTPPLSYEKSVEFLKNMYKDGRL